MKLALSKIVGKPIAQNGALVGYAFVVALQKLAADPLPIKDRYALARTLEDVERWVKVFETRRLEIAKKHCITRGEFLTNRAKGLRDQITAAQQGEVRHPGLKRFQESLARIEAELVDGGGDGLVPANEEKNKAL